MKGTSKAIALLLTAGLGLTACAPQADLASLETQSQTGIVNGVAVEDQDRIAASTVALYFVRPQVGSSQGDIQNFCTGTLISRTVVLTAAHCLADVAKMMDLTLEDLMPSIRVGFGTQVASSLSDSRVEFREVAAARVHEKYVIDSVQQATKVPMYDIGLVRLAAPAPTSARVVKLVSNASALVKGRDLTLAGFGLINGWPRVSAKQLMKVNVKVDNPAVTPVQFTYRVEGGRSACSGDSGGPAYVTNAKGELLVVGVTSWGDQFCKMIGAYTTVPVFVSWIQETIRSL
jgi:secreted trypsin-like serine protease